MRDEPQFRARSVVGEALRNARRDARNEKGRRLSAKDAVQLLNRHLSAPVSEWTLYKIEEGSAPISLELLKAAQVAFKVHDDSLVRLYLDHLAEYQEDNRLQGDDARAPAAPNGYVRVTVKAPEALSHWSVKGVIRVTKYVRSFLGVARRYVQLPENLGNIRRGMTLAFSTGDMPHFNVYLLCISKTNPDIQTVRYIDPDDPHILKDHGHDEKLDDWEVVGWAEGVSWGLGEIHDKFYVDGAGIGPNTRLPS